ncbi:UBP1-associated protein 2B [Cryptomeria japonica]|uniref:UBP1-associated protein 2B n=1 Tax=Cryptomeria japonica TaxID=3369 RepID=UPI0025AD0748|nr:UBP1-associated protein 2B [Cryptomeria japonica]XP_057824305.1 UBP1-associated protein 2B [Cryptomeria japonica]
MAKKRKAGEEKLTPQPQPPSEKIIKKEEEEEEKIDNGEEDQISEEDFKALMEPFSKEQLCHIIRDLAANDANVLSDIRKLADKDPAHRKIFVRGIGWDTTSEILKSVFSEYGELEECTVIMDKGTGKSKGYGFVTYKHMDAAQRAMKEPSKKIDNRMAACQMACLGPVPQQPTSDPAGRKIYVSNVPADMPADKLLSFFSKYGEVEEGPLGFDKQTGKSRGFALFIYKTAEGAKKVLEEPNKNIDGHSMHCKRATENQKPKINVTHTVPSVAGPLDPNDLALTYGKGSSLGAAYGVFPFNQVAAPGFSNAFNAILASQNQTFAGTSMDPSRLASMNPSLASSLNSSSLSQAFSPSGQGSLGLVGSYGMHSSLGPYGSQQGGIGGVTPQMFGGYGSQGAALQGLSPYQSQQLSQSGLSRTSQQTGGSSLGGMSSYLPY